MNTDQAKKLEMPDILAKLGHTPVKQIRGGRELWYSSPFRDEKDASFHTSIGRNGNWIWKDFGDNGGNVLDFAMRHLNTSSISDALAFLDSLYQPNLFQQRNSAAFSFHQQPHRGAVENFSEDSQLKFLKAVPIERKTIINYLVRERSIPLDLAKNYLLEIHYHNYAKNSDYYAFGMKNQSNGYEIRVASSQYPFKSALIVRDITLLKGTDINNQQVSIFEGMVDFLSLLVLKGVSALPGDAIIMHSLSSYKHAVETISKANYDSILTYLDNDKPGLEGTEKFIKDFSSKVIPQNHTFSAYNDLNDALCAKHKGIHRK